MNNHPLGIGIIGNGNVAGHLLKSLSAPRLKTVANVTHINSRQEVIDICSEGLPLDILLIAVSDNAIEEVTSKIPASFSGIVAHVSGTTPLSFIKSGAGRGILYPLMTFSKDVELDYTQIPFFVCADSNETEQKLVKLASMLSDKVSVIDEQTLPSIHLAGVFACNFTNHLLGISADLLAEKQLNLDILYPLIQETIRKGISNGNPYLTQTGPAKRHDITTINKHEEMLKNKQDFLKIYRMMTESIMNQQ